MKMLARILLLLSAFPVLASDKGNLQDALKKDYEKHVIAMRTPFQTGDQEFDSSGQPLKAPATDKWQVYGPLLITRIKPDSDKLRLEAVRVDSPSVHKPDKKHLLESGKTTRIEIHLDHPLTSTDEARGLLNRVFFVDLKHCDYQLPEYRRPDQTADSKETIYHVGPNVTVPRAMFSPDPDFSDQARREKYQGTVVLGVVVDPSGRISRIKILRPLGMGLDEMSVQKVATWKFEPALHDGKPVAVEVS